MSTDTHPDCRPRFPTVAGKIYTLCCWNPSAQSEGEIFCRKWTAWILDQHVAGTDKKFSDIVSFLPTFCWNHFGIMFCHKVNTRLWVSLRMVGKILFVCCVFLLFFLLLCFLLVQLPASRVNDHFQVKWIESFLCILRGTKRKIWSDPDFFSLGPGNKWGGADQSLRSATQGGGRFIVPLQTVLSGHFLELQSEQNFIVLGVCTQSESQK